MRTGQPLRAQELTHSEAIAAAQTAAHIQLAYAQRGSSLAVAALAGAQRFVTLAHHPRRDVADARTGVRFYYHAHRHGTGEHGHFHLFAYRSPTPGQAAQRFFHLAALSLDHRGQPLQWFTTNQWVTGEHWAPAADVHQALAGFSVQTRGRLAPVAQWLTAMVTLFRPQLAQLLTDRDRALARHTEGSTHAAVWANREIDVLSSTSADLHARVQQLGV